MSIPIVLSPQSPDTLWMAVQAAQAGDPLEPVTVVGPSNYANLSLRHSFARKGFANVRFMAFPRLAELLGARALAAQGMTPLSPVLESAATRAVSEDATGALRTVRSHPMTHQSLKFAFRQLRRVSGDTLDRLVEQGGLPADTVALYRKYRDKTSAFYDAERLAAAAADSVRDGSATALDDLGFVIFFHLREMTTAQRQLVSALADQNRCAVLLNATGDDDADKPFAGIAAALDIPHNLERAAEDEQNRSSARLASAQLVISPDPHQEIRSAIRHIMSLAERGVPFHRMAVLYRQTAPYGALIGEEMQVAGVPVAGPGHATLADTGAGRALSGLMEIADGEFARGAVAAWFTGSPVKSPTDTTDDNSAARFNPSRWDKLSKQAGIVGGLDQWLNRLQLYANNQNQRADDGENQGEIDEGRAGWMRRDAKVAIALREFIEDLAERVSRPSDGSAWSDFAGWAKGLLSAYVAIPADADQPEHDALDTISSGLDTLVVAGEIELEPDFSSFRRALDELLSQVVGHLGSIGQGVFVAPIRQAAGMRFDYLHMVGMVEGAMPPALRDDPLIPDVARQEVGGAAAELPTRAERRALERYDYLAALATAPDATLSYPVADPAGGRANSPSRWLLEQASLLHGDPVYASDLPRLSGESWLTILPSFEAALAATSETGHADLADYDLERLWRWTEAGLPTSNHPLAAHVNDALPGALALSRARYGFRFTEWDGNVSSAARGARFSDGLLNRVHSPTSLQNWAKCPFSYFLGNVLRLGDTESPEDAHSITPLDKGNLVHKILEEFVSEVIEDETLPAPNETWADDHLQRLLAIAERRFSEAEERGITGKPVMWRLESDGIRADLESFLEMDAEIRAKYGVSPMRLEAAFGMKGEAWREASWRMNDGETIKLRGFIDRVDVSPDRRRALVLDYKSGGSRYYDGLKDDPTDRGKLLQLGAYALAAERQFGNRVDVLAAYSFPTSRGGFKLMPSEPLNLGDEGKRQRFGQVFAILASGVRGGIFPANPGKSGRYGPENCGYCDFDSLCPSRRAVLWSKKRNDKAVAAYRELAEGDLE